MALMARALAPGYTHHVIRGGNRRQQTCLNDGDYQIHLDLELMPNTGIRPGIRGYAIRCGTRSEYDMYELIFDTISVVIPIDG